MSLRHGTFEAELACFGEHRRAIGGECFAEQDSACGGGKPLERFASRFPLRRDSLRPRQ
jgi:hypothetical protein